MRCHECGLDLPADARFCSGCGVAQGSSSDASEQIPAQVLSNLRGEERLATVVFADLTESVRRTSGLSPEEATDMVNPLLEAMVELMLRHGGRIDRFLGDGVLAVFGVPTAHEDDPIRAVRAAMELGERAASLGLSVTVGINTGRVYFGPVGSSLHEELTVMGPTVNLAARLQSAAEPEQILVGEATRIHVERSFHLRPVTLSVKGIAGPVTAYSAEYLTDHPDKVRGIQGLDAELVGRDAEMEILSGWLARPRGPVALIGPAGVGKSRLAAEFNRRARGQGAGWLEGRCLELTRNLPYAPFVDMLRRQLGRDRTADALAERVSELVSGGVLETERAADVTPFLAALLGGPDGARLHHRVAGTDPGQRRRLTIRALVDYLTASASLHPTVVFLEDLHWSDDASLETVEALNRATDGLPLMLLLAYRPEEDAPDLAARLGRKTTELHLSALSPDESRVLISRLLDVSGIPSELETRIVANAAGNPFYVEELIRMLIQRGILVQRNQQWEAVASIEAVGVPETLEGLLMSRFDRLPVPIKQSARVVSVLDGEFDATFVSTLAGDELAARLTDLAEAGLISTQRATDPPTYAFLHDLTRQAIYSSLLPSQRTELHGRAGATLEELRPNDLERLAHHYQHSAHDEKAVRFSLAAAEASMASHAHPAALHHLDVGGERIARLPTEHQESWTALYRARRGEILERQAHHHEARVELLAALEHLDGDPYERARTWRLVGQTQRMQGQFTEAHASYDRAEEALEDVADGDSVEARRAWIEVQQERAHALYFGGRGGELPDHNARMAPLVEEFGTVAQRVDLHRAMAMDAFVRRRFLLDASTVELMRRSLELAQTGADPGRVAESTFVFGFTLLWADRIEEAVPVLERAVAEAVRVDDVVHENRARVYHAVALRRAGRVEEADRAATSALELSARLDNDYYRGHSLSTLCWAGWRRGDGACRSRGEEAYSAWGPHEDRGARGFNTEFAWMAAWPLAADAMERGDTPGALGHLRYLLSPWERAKPDDLEEAVRRATDTAEEAALQEALDLATEHRLL